MQKFIEYFWKYALANGIFSSRYNKKTKRFESTSANRIYAVVANVLTLTTFPWAVWNVVGGAIEKDMYSKLMIVMNCVLFGVRYASMVFTILSRRYRENELELGLVRRVLQLEAELVRREAFDERSECYLRRLLYAKSGIAVYLSISMGLNCLCAPQDKNLSFILAVVIIVSGMNILSVTTFSYFLGMWHICRCFFYINKRLIELSGTATSDIVDGDNVRQESEVELHRVWCLHALLTRTTLRLNDVYSYQMLATRFDYIVAKVVAGYYAYVYSFSFHTPGYVLAFGMFTYLMDTLDFYLLNLMCAETVAGQRRPASIMPAWIEHSERFQRELNAFCTYLHSSKLCLWICGLYEVNKRSWFIGLSTIVSYTIILLQFHMYLRNKDKV